MNTTGDHDPFKNANRVGGIIITLIGVAILYLGLTGYGLLPPFNIIRPWEFFVDARVLGPSVLIGAIVGFLIMIGGIALATSSVWDAFTRHRKLRFRIPDDPSLKVRSITDRYHP